MYRPRFSKNPDKAVYGYAVEQYQYWKDELPRTSLSWGAFVENLTTAGLHENTLHMGIA
jgi:MOSC domain-containing protein YiiM